MDSWRSASSRADNRPRVASSASVDARRANAASSGKVDRIRSGPLRSKASSAVTWCQPAPSSPSSMSPGTTTESKTTSLKW